MTEGNKERRIKMNKHCFITALLFCLILVGCGSAAKIDKAETRFEKVEEVSCLYDIYVDRETGVMYAVSRGIYNQGNFTVLVDADGKPLLWKGDKR